MKLLLGCMWLSFTAHLGGVLGMLLTGALLMRPAVERYQAEHPGERPCGMFHAPYTCLGLGLGFPAGAWFGWWSSRRYAPGWWRSPGPSTAEGEKPNGNA